MEGRQSDYTYRHQRQYQARHHLRIHLVPAIEEEDKHPLQNRLKDEAV